jgi:polyhydroxyalkanoate synthase
MAYRRHPYRRALPTPPTLWAEGTTRLLDYRRAEDAAPRRRRRARSPAAMPVLAVPSLINRAYILDLAAEQSFLRFLAAAGIEAFLLDWDAPGEAERAFTLDDYVRRIERAVARVRAATGVPPALLGYCMGGTLTAAVAARAPDSIAALIALAAPWEFHAADLQGPQGVQARMLAGAYGLMAPLVEALQAMPVDLIQGLFAALDPTLALRKFARFAALPADGAEARRFVALEDWLNDGVPLAARVAGQCLRGWYGENAPARGEWTVAGRAIRPAAVAVPTLVVLPARDRIVPPAAAEALAAAIPRAERWRPSLGHVGMMASTAAPRALWRPLADWLAARR